MRDLSASFMLHTEPSPTWRDQTRRSHGLPVGLTTASPTAPGWSQEVQGQGQGQGQVGHATPQDGTSCFLLGP